MAADGRGWPDTVWGRCLAGWGAGGFHKASKNPYSQARFGEKPEVLQRRDAKFDEEIRNLLIDLEVCRQLIEGLLSGRTLHRLNALCHDRRRGGKDWQAQH